MADNEMIITTNNRLKNLLPRAESTTTTTATPSSSRLVTPLESLTIEPQLVVPDDSKEGKEYELSTCVTRMIRFGISEWETPLSILPSKRGLISEQLPTSPILHSPGFWGNAPQNTLGTV